MKKEPELKNLIEELEINISHYRSTISGLRKALEEEETKLIRAKITLDSTNEELRIIDARRINRDPTPREIEISDFKKVFPDILKQLETEKPRK